MILKASRNPLRRTPSSHVAERSFRPRAPREAGSIQVAAAAALLVVALSAAMIVDSGRIALARRELQLQVDLAALAASRSIGTCAATAGSPSTIAASAAAANGFVLEPDASTFVVEVGNVASVDGVREFVVNSDLAEATAVQVTATQSIRRSLVAAGLLPGTTRVEASAVARSHAEVSFSVGSFLVRVDLDNLPVANLVLGQLLDGTVGLDLISYQGLAASQVRIGDLIDASADFGTVDELVVADVVLADFLDSMSLALSSGGQVAAALTTETLASATDPARTVQVADFLSITGEDDAASEARVNVLDLIFLAAQAAAQSETLVVDPLALSVPGIANTRLVLAIIEPARMAIGPPGRDAEGEWRTQIVTAQVRMQLDLALADALPLLSGPAVGMSLYVDAARTEAHLESISCASFDDPVDRVGVGVEPGLVRIGLGAFDDLLDSGSVSPANLVTLTLFGLPLARVSGWADLDVQSPPGSLDFDGPFSPATDGPLPDHVQTLGGDLGTAVDLLVDALDDAYELEIELLRGLPLGLSSAGILSAVTNLITPVLSGISPLLTSVMDVCGLHLGGADVSVHGIYTRPPVLIR